MEGVAAAADSDTAARQAQPITPAAQRILAGSGQQSQSPLPPAGDAAPRVPGPAAARGDADEGSEAGGPRGTIPLAAAAVRGVAAGGPGCRCAVS